MALLQFSLQNREAFRHLPHHDPVAYSRSPVFPRKELVHTCLGPSCYVYCAKDRSSDNLILIADGISLHEAHIWSELLNTGLGNYFLDMTAKAKATKAKMNK